MYPIITAKHTLLRSYWAGDAIPLVSGSFGELNVDGHCLIDKCAKYAASLVDNSDITPEDVHYAKGSPYNLFLGQFWQAIGCLVVWTVAHEKL